MISQFFIDRPIFANVIAVVTVIVGLVCLYRLPVAQYPQIVPGTIQVSARYPGASASVVAATVGLPIEEAVNGVENSIYMSSASSSDGSYTLTITFDVGTDLNTAMALVQNLVNGALAQLPGNSQQQGVTVRKVSPNILLVASLYSEDDRFDEAFLSNYALINLEYPLGRLPGVGQVRVFGAGPYSMRVWLDPDRLQSYGLSTADVLAAVKGQNAEVAAGQLGAPPVPEDQPFQFTVSALQRSYSGGLSPDGMHGQLGLQSTESLYVAFTNMAETAVSGPSAFDGSDRRVYTNTMEGAARFIRGVIQ